MIRGIGLVLLRITCPAILLGTGMLTSVVTAQESIRLYERNALAGNYTAQRNTAYCLRTAKCQDVIFPRPIEACAWRIVILASGHHWVNQSDSDNYREECVSGLSPEDQASALAEADHLFSRIYKRPLPHELLPP